MTPPHAPLPEDAFPLTLSHGAVVSEAVGVVLDRLPPGAFVAQDAASEHGALILGMNSAEGPTSLLDIRIGQVGGGRGRGGLRS